MNQVKKVKAQAWGRVNLIGEHTDYNGGYVLPTAIPQTTFVELTTREDQQVIGRSQNVPTAEKTAGYQLGDEKTQNSWVDYLQGVTSVLRSENFRIQGFEVSVHSGVPLGSGLSSSAALEVSLFRALRDAFDLALNDVQIAQLCRKVENDFVGAKVGIMDPMACSLSKPGKALFLDTLDLSYRAVPLPSDADLIVINSGVSHRNVAGGYNARRGECEEACKILGIHVLRELSLDSLETVKAQLPETLFKRVRHVVTENERVLRTVEALELDNLKRVGQLFVESHKSMRDDYEVSVPETDLLVELAISQEEIYGARLTGGGFGGSIVAFAKQGQGATVAQRVVSLYEQQTQNKATVLVPNGDGERF